MKQWFPFTDYDFYAYLTAGLFLLLGLDLAATGGELMLRPTWPIVQVVMLVAAAYVLGQLAAGPSSNLLEHFAARRLLRSPASLLLGLSEPRLAERMFSAIFIGRNYGPLPGAMRKRILDRTATTLGVPAITDAEEVFQVAFPAARGSADAVARMDQFRNLYGFCRNISFVSLVSAICLALRAFLAPLPYSGWEAAAALVVCVGMFGRFLKFYADFAAEVLRSYHHALPKEEPDKTP
jgi:hypothetical protein